MAIEKFAREMNKTAEGRNTLQKIFDAISNFLKKMKEVFRGDVARVRSEAFASLNFEQNFKEVVAQLEEAEALWKELAKAAITESETAKTKNTADDSGVRYSLKAFSDGRKFVDVDVDQELFDGLTIAEMNALAKKIIKKRFAGNVIGINNKVFVNGKSAEKYIYFAPGTDTQIIEAKARASTELDKLIEAGTNFRKQPDGEDGHIHPDVVDGFSYFDTIFKVGDQYYLGIINIKNIAKGRLLWGVTKTKNITEDIHGSYGENPTTIFLSDVSINKISQPDDSVNTQDDGLRNSEKDTDYLAAVKRGDMETAQRMVDEADQYFTSSVLLHNPPSSIKGKIFLCQFILKDEEKVQPIGRTFSFLF